MLARTASKACPVARPGASATVRARGSSPAGAAWERLAYRSTGAAVPATTAAPGGGGSPLPPAALDDFAGRFGVRFDDVRIHRGAGAAAAARAVHALAYTVGRDVVMGDGAAALGTPSGRRLLAHELTHVVQQTGGAAAPGGGAVRGLASGISRAPGPTISRAPLPSDVQIRGLAGTAASRAAAIDTIFFDRGLATLDPTEAPKVPPLATRFNTVPHTLRGFRSEEEPASLASTRITTVTAAMGSSSTRGPPSPQPGASEGQLNYRDWRKVDVQLTGAAPATASCAGVAPTHACAGTDESTFQTARSAAATDVLTAFLFTTTASAGSPTAGLLDRFFGAGVAGVGFAVKSEVASNLANIYHHITRIADPAAHICGDTRCPPPDCQASGAFTLGLGVGAPATGGSGGIFATLCPSFFGGSAVWQRNTIVHESSHGTSGLISLGGAARSDGTDDYAYESERLFPVLPTAQALGNADSYALFVESVAHSAVGPTTPFTDAPDSTFTTTELADVRLAVGRAEKWITWAQQNIASLYDTMLIAAAHGSWTHPDVPTYGPALMDIVSPPGGPPSRFALTTTAAGPPTVADRAAVAAIEDRLLNMQTAFEQALTLNKNLGSATTSWSGGSPPATITFGTNFFALPAGSPDQALLLVRRLAFWAPGVSAAVQSAYVEIVNDIQATFHP